MKNKSYLGYLTKYDEIGYGANSYIYYADYKDSVCACKEFIDEKYVELIKDKMYKLKEKYEVASSNVFPFEFLYKKPSDENFVAYITDYMYNYSSLNSFQNLSFEQKINILKKCRERIENIHKYYNIIHCDIYPENILYNEQEDKECLIDFDTYIDLKTKQGYMPNNMNELADKYIRSHGIDKDVDIFLFNLCCYTFLNNTFYYNSIKHINNENYGNIENEFAIKILNSYKDFESNKSLKKEYIIDYL